MATSVRIASLFLGVASICGLAACTDEELSGLGDASEIPFQEVAIGDDGAIASSPQFRLIENQAALDSLYSQQARIPPLQPPVVDFEHDVAYFATRGPRPSTGYSIAITGLRHVRIGDGIEGIEVLAEAGGPASDCTVGFAFTSPFVLISIPREELKSGVVRVNLREKVYHCDE